MDALGDEGENTAVVFLSDNGGVANAATGDFRGSKGVSYEGGVRTPLFIHWPKCLGSDQGPRATHEPLFMQDLYSTLLSLGGDWDQKEEKLTRKAKEKLGGSLKADGPASEN